MRRMTTVLVVLLVMAAVALAGAPKADAQSTQTVETLIGKVLERYTLPTSFGNVYFNQRDVKHLVHAAAKLRPVDLGSFQTDQAKWVKVRVTGFDRGMVTFVISST
ncbi:hypothetical protein K8I61_03685 [bacterium]|nr:hypothetical protein [bacterium]